MSSDSYSHINNFVFRIRYVRNTTQSTQACSMCTRFPISSSLFLPLRPSCRAMQGSPRQPGTLLPFLWDQLILLLSLLVIGYLLWTLTNFGLLYEGTKSAWPLELLRWGEWSMGLGCARKTCSKQEIITICRASALRLYWKNPKGFLISTKFRGSSSHFRFDHFYIVDFHSSLTFPDTDLRNEGRVKIYNVKMFKTEMARGPPKLCWNQKSFWILSN